MWVILLLPLVLAVRLFAPLVTTAGKAIASGRMFGSTPSQAEPKYIGWGTSTTAESVSQTDLVAAAVEARVAGTASQVTTTTTNDTAQWVGTITASAAHGVGGGTAISEVALFDAAGSGSPPTGGTMFLRAVHGAQNLGVGDGTQYTVGCQFT